MKTNIISNQVNNTYSYKFISNITQCVGDRVKLYANMCENEKKHLKCKGVKSCVVKKELNINLYRDVLFSRKSFQVSQNGIRSYKHQLYTETIKESRFICN